MMDDASSGLREGSARFRIHRAAMRLFAEKNASEVNISELAEAAGIARGTIYNNIADPENLFGEVAYALAQEMILRTEATMRSVSDTAERTATGLRLFIRRAHEEQDWGRFLVRFLLSNATLQDLMLEPPARDIEQAIRIGRFKIEASRIPTLVAILAGSTIAAMNAVIRGEQAWRESGSATAELILRASGVGAAEARRLSQIELPLLAPLPPSKRSSRQKKS